MRSLIISLVLSAAIVWGSVIYTGRLERLSEEMLDINSRITECVERGDYGAAREEIYLLCAFMDKKRAAMEATGNHEELDEIEMNISELITYSEEESRADALAKCRVLDFLISHLPKNFKLKIENIL
ncbi:MAG: DUF4363 family protein [Clostridiales bacterium]|nr:DUF4363 family protein [Clostridiales bacterium]